MTQRRSKACEPCRVKKTKCEPETTGGPFCSECVRNGDLDACITREKARPKRAPPHQDSEAARPKKVPKLHDEVCGTQATAAVIAAPTIANESFINQIERIVQGGALESYGLVLDLSLTPENVLPIKASTPLPPVSDFGLTPHTQTALNLATHYVNVHLSGIHHSTPFLHPPQLYDLVERLFHPSNKLYNKRPELESDELGFLYIVLALGSLRADTFDDASCQHHAMASQASVSSDIAGSIGTGQVSLALYRHAVAEIDSVTCSSETAVQALFLLHTYVSNTSMGRKSKDFVARAVMMAHEIGLNGLIPETPLPDVAKRRATLYLYVYFSDVYLAALHNQPPLIKSQDYDPDIFNPILFDSSPSSAENSKERDQGVSSFVDLVRVQGEVLERLRSGSTWTGPEAIMRILDLESRLDSLRSRLSKRTFGLPNAGPGITADAKANRADLAGRLLRQIHFNWCRIVLRAPTINSSPLSHSSLAVCARAACSLLWHYQNVCSLGLLNLPWMQLRRIATAGHIVFIAFWKGELLPHEAISMIDIVLSLCQILSTRWEAAAKVSLAFKALSDASGLKCSVPLHETYFTDMNHPSDGEHVLESSKNHVPAVHTQPPQDDVDSLSRWFLNSDMQVLCSQFGVSHFEIVSGLWDFADAATINANPSSTEWSWGENGL